MSDLIRGLAYSALLAWQWAYIAAVVLWAWCKVVRPSDRLEKAWRLLARIHQELWPFAPAGFMVSVMDLWHGSYPWLIVIQAWALLTWWQARNWPEDNHWKRHGKKAKEAVQRRAGRLVVVPAAEGAS